MNHIAYKQQKDNLKRVLNKLQYLGFTKESILEIVKELLNPEEHTLNSNEIASNENQEEQELRGRKKGLSLSAQQKAISALKLYEKGMSIKNISISLEISSKSTVYKYIKFATEIESSNNSNAVVNKDVNYISS